MSSLENIKIKINNLDMNNIQNYKKQHNDIGKDLENYKSTFTKVSQSTKSAKLETNDCDNLLETMENFNTRLKKINPEIISLKELKEIVQIKNALEQEYNNTIELLNNTENKVEVVKTDRK